MKQWFHAFCMCQSMFCYIPFPGNVWDEEARDKMLLCLPLVGLEIGLIWLALGWLCSLLKLPGLLAALVLAFYPYIATGFMHLDGFMDVTDAVKSWRSLERRREILKDSHVGSFAVIGVAMLLIAQFAVFASLGEDHDLRALALIPVVSRCCSVLAVINLPPMQTSQYAGREKSTRNILIPAVMLVLALAAGFLLSWKTGCVLLGGMAGFGLALRRAYKSLEGMNGDISGYSLTYSELAAAAVLALL